MGHVKYLTKLLNKCVLESWEIWGTRLKVYLSDPFPQTTLQRNMVWWDPLLPDTGHLILHFALLSLLVCVFSFTATATASTVWTFILRNLTCPYCHCNCRQKEKVLSLPFFSIWGKSRVSAIWGDIWVTLLEKNLEISVVFSNIYWRKQILLPQWNSSHKERNSDVGCVK